MRNRELALGGVTKYFACQAFAVTWRGPTPRTGLT